MTNHRHDPVGAAEIWRAKLDTAIEQFNARKISDDVFRASLYSAGFRGERLRDEFRFHDINRTAVPADGDDYADRAEWRARL